MRGVKKPIFESQILAVHKIAVSKQHCADLLGITRQTYIKYAKLYGLDIKFVKPKKEKVKRKPKNPFKVNRPIDLILQNKYKGIHSNTLKNKLFESGIKKEECEICKYSDKREIDGKSPLMLKFKDKNKDNYTITNLEIICFNCYFTYYNGWYLQGKVIPKCEKIKNE